MREKINFFNFRQLVLDAQKADLDVHTCFQYVLIEFYRFINDFPEYFGRESNTIVITGVYYTVFVYLHQILCPTFATGPT